MAQFPPQSPNLVTHMSHSFPDRIIPTLASPSLVNKGANITPLTNPYLLPTMPTLNLVLLNGRLLSTFFFFFFCSPLIISSQCSHLNNRLPNPHSMPTLVTLNLVVAILRASLLSISMLDTAVRCTVYMDASPSPYSIFRTLV